MSAPANFSNAPYREVQFGSREVTMERTPEGIVYVRPTTPLGSYPARLTDCLDHWAVHRSDTTFFAKRDEEGNWHRLAYKPFREEARRVAQALIDRAKAGVIGKERPIAILSGNDLQHAIMGFAAYYAGITYAPVSTAYSLVSTDFAKLKIVFNLLTPGLIMVPDAGPYKRALQAVAPPDAEIVVTGDPGDLKATHWSSLIDTEATDDVDKATAAVTPDTVAKILFTSGSTGTPKGVMNTHRMLTSNQQVVRNVLAFIEKEPPVIVDWLPWNHTFSGNHDVGFVLYNGGSFYIDEGRPTPTGMEASVRNLEDVGPNIYLNVPKGFEMLIPFLQQRPSFRKKFFENVKLFYYAGAGLLQPVWDELDRLAVETVGKRIIVFTGLGATETGPAAMFTNRPDLKAGDIGLPAPGVELKLVPHGDKLEARVRGDGITPGYWRQPEITARVFDEEGFYSLGDAIKFNDPDDVTKGFKFDGRIAEDFKLSSGTFVSAGPMRAQFLVHCAPYAQDAVLAGPDLDFVTVLIWPALDACRTLGNLPADAPASQVVAHPAVRAKFQELLNELASRATGSSNRIARAILLDTPPSIDAHEVTDKGSINQSAVLKHRAALVADLYSPRPSARVISIQKEIS